MKFALLVFLLSSPSDTPHVIKRGLTLQECGAMVAKGALQPMPPDTVYVCAPALMPGKPA